MKKIQILALSALLLTVPLAIAQPVYAADGTKQEQQQKRPPRRPQLTMEEMQTVLSQKYFVTPEETKSLIDSGTSFRDLERAAKLSYISGKPVKDILALKKDEPWQRVEVLIGAVGEKAYQKDLELKAMQIFAAVEFPIILESNKGNSFIQGYTDDATLSRYVDLLLDNVDEKKEKNEYLKEILQKSK